MYSVYYSTVSVSATLSHVNICEQTDSWSNLWVSA
jgi:hypothetical protein